MLRLVAPALLLSLAFGLSMRTPDGTRGFGCDQVQCGDIECMAPAKEVSDGGCCPVCRFPGSLKKIMTPAEMHEWYHGLDVPEGAKDPNCKGAYCGTPLCLPTEEIHNSPGAYCGTPLCLPTEEIHHSPGAYCGTPLCLPTEEIHHSPGAYCGTPLCL